MILENPRLLRVLNTLENALIPGVEKSLEESWRAFADGQFDGDVFMPARTPRPELPDSFDLGMPVVNDTLADTEEGYINMLMQQYIGCISVLRRGTGELLCVRGNYGSGILSQAFGCENFLMEHGQNTLPTTVPLGADAIGRLLQKGIPDLTAGFAGQAMKACALMKEIGEKHPKIGKYVHVYHPDWQGPIDLCELIWGSDMFYDIYDRPELVHDMLSLITETYTAFARRWFAVFPPSGYGVHWGMMHKGTLMLREDSAMNLSPAQFNEFIRPYDQTLLDRFGGGAAHACGRADHYIGSLTEMEGLYAFNLTQPEYNDMDTVYSATVDKGVQLLNLNREIALARRGRCRGRACVI